MDITMMPSEETLLFCRKVVLWVVGQSTDDDQITFTFKEDTPKEILDLFEAIKDKLFSKVCKGILLLELALEIAEQAHAGQVDKAGKDYIQHPIYVSSLVESPEAKAVALLHDVLEDSDYTAEALLEAGVPYKIVEAVEILTKQPGESYDDYLCRVMDNELARVVKIADLTHNSDLTRLHKVTQQDLDRQEKYREAIVFLAMAEE